MGASPRRGRRRSASSCWPRPAAQAAFVRGANAAAPLPFFFLITIFLLSFFFFFFPFRFPLSFFLLLLFLFFFFSFLLSNLKVMLASYQVPHRSPVDERSPYSVLVSSAWGFKEAPKPTSEHHALLSSPQFFFQKCMLPKKLGPKNKRH